jgi:hypothetical protein
MRYALLAGAIIFLIASAPEGLALGNIPTWYALLVVAIVVFGVAITEGHS